MSSEHHHGHTAPPRTARHDSDLTIMMASMADRCRLKPNWRTEEIRNTPRLLGGPGGGQLERDPAACPASSRRHTGRNAEGDSAGFPGFRSSTNPRFLPCEGAPSSRRLRLARALPSGPGAAFLERICCTADASSSSATLGASAMSVPHVDARSPDSSAPPAPGTGGGGNSANRTSRRSRGSRALCNRGRPRVRV